MLTCPSYSRLKVEHAMSVNLHLSILIAIDSLVQIRKGPQIPAKSKNLNQSGDNFLKLTVGTSTQRVRCARCKVASLRLWQGVAQQTCPRREQVLSKTSLAARPDSEETDNKGVGAWTSRYRSFNCTVESGLNCECEWCNTRYVLCV